MKVSLSFRTLRFDYIWNEFTDYDEESIFLLLSFPNSISFWNIFPFLIENFNFIILSENVALLCNFLSFII